MPHNSTQPDTNHQEIASDCTGSRFRPTRPPSPADTNDKSRLLSNASDWLTDYKPGVPMTPSLGLTGLLEWLTQFRKPIYSLGYWFTTKDITNQQPDEKRQKERSWTKEHLPSGSLRRRMVAGGSVLVHQSESTIPEAFNEDLLCPQLGKNHCQRLGI